MDWRPAALLLITVLMVPFSTAEPQFNIRKSCQADEVALFSLFSKTGGNVGQPGYYTWDVCGTGIEDADTRSSCNSDENSLISMYKKNDSHASTFTGYRWNVCATDINTSVKSSCTNDAIVSLHKKDDTHVAEPGHYSSQLCVNPVKSVDNVTLRMTTDSGQVYVSGDSAQEKTYTAFDLNYPYIVSDRPIGVVSYDEIVNVEYVNNSRDVFRVTQTGGSFLIPHTTGGLNSVRRRDNLVTDRELATHMSPSFGFQLEDQPTVKVALQPEQTVKGFSQTITRNVDIVVRNKGLQDGNLVIKFFED